MGLRGRSVSASEDVIGDPSRPGTNTSKLLEPRREEREKVYMYIRYYYVRCILVTFLSPLSPPLEREVLYERTLSDFTRLALSHIYAALTVAA